jgi:2-C-methyl-D-erythritol 4-phosphate cytidylyltransferase
MGGQDKMFASVKGRPLLGYTLEAFQRCDSIRQIALVLNQANLDMARELVCLEGLGKVTAICLGGERRQDSVHAGLMTLNPCDLVAIHDGARPLIDIEVIEAGLAAAAEVGAAVPALPVVDTLKEVGSRDLIERTVPRQRLWAAQTPQIFRYDLLLEAHERVHEDVTDDASMLEQLGYPVKVYPGSPRNIKVTSPGDLKLLEAFLTEL